MTRWASSDDESPVRKHFSLPRTQALILLPTAVARSRAAQPARPTLTLSSCCLREARPLVRRTRQEDGTVPRANTFRQLPSFQPSQGDSFIDRQRVESFRDRFLPEGAPFRDRGCSFRRERLCRRQSETPSLSSPPPPVSRESRKRSPESSRSILRAKYFPPQRAPNGTSSLKTVQMKALPCVMGASRTPPEDHRRTTSRPTVQGYLTHKKTPPPRTLP